ncbi:MAG: response regulator transcription factor [Pseudomonadota bacterium]
MQKILIVEDEANLAKGLKFNLEMENYEAHTIDTAEEALDIFMNFDMMILDIMLPKMDGITALKEIRKQNPKFPILILSAKKSEESIVSGLQEGADDYMTKPFSLKELLLRINRILSRQSWYNDSTKKLSSYNFSRFSIDFEAFEAKTARGHTKLTQYECFVMKYLIENKNQIVSRQELLENVWGYESKEIETRTVDIFIARLRKLFENNPKNPLHIISIRGLGYKFVD